MSKLIQAMVMMESIFNEYAGKDGDSSSLSKKEVADLLRAEFGVEKADMNSKVDDALKQLDLDGDNKVDYCEFVLFVAQLMIAMKEIGE